MAKEPDLARLATLRAARQLLHRPRRASRPADIARAICGVQAQEPPAGRLGFRARHPSLTAGDVEQARTEERSLVRMWVMRNTVHLIATEDLPWMRPLFAPLMARFNRRRLGQLGLDSRAQDRALGMIERTVAAEGAMTRTQLAERISRGGIELDASRRVHLFPLAVSTGIACIGPGEGAKTTLVAAGDWLPEGSDLDRKAALGELARRYLAAFAPATEADFAGWAGLPLRDIRAGLDRVAPELREITIRGQRAWTPKGRSPAVAPHLVRLLPAFDNYLMGHRDRAFLATPDLWRRVGPGGGILRPAITIGGAVAGTWKPTRGGRRLRVELEPFASLGTEAEAAVAAEVADVHRFEGTDLP